VSSHRHSAYLPNMRRKASAGFGLRVERVPVAYQRGADRGGRVVEVCGLVALVLHMHRASSFWVFGLCTGRAYVLG
jgi:hypothetical protein